MAHISAVEAVKSLVDSDLRRQAFVGCAGEVAKTVKKLFGKPRTPDFHGHFEFMSVFLCKLKSFVKFRFIGGTFKTNSFKQNFDHRQNFNGEFREWLFPLSGEIHMRRVIKTLVFLSAVLVSTITYGYESAILEIRSDLKGIESDFILMGGGPIAGVDIGEYVAEDAYQLLLSYSICKVAINAIEAVEVQLYLLTNQSASSRAKLGKGFVLMFTEPLASGLERDIKALKKALQVTNNNVVRGLGTKLYVELQIFLNYIVELNLKLKDTENDYNWFSLEQG